MLEVTFQSGSAISAAVTSGSLTELQIVVEVETRYLANDDGSIKLNYANQGLSTVYPGKNYPFRTTPADSSSRMVLNFG